ncbi:hypothetical protein BV22DRAFT_1129623 [Leucogyrophana mollusca]|uniref:Uncharacterized protein n=1 Tax=Leucogyrophana mollusca TaxID=85980 RepID=A0ACB8BG26_9AGAM|nr:hypothetical protein BV22DRAFT_1129623 [Leucogyrophana mollusca]
MGEGVGMASDIDVVPEDIDAMAEDIDMTLVTGGRESVQTQYNPLRDWLPYRDVYLDELLRHDGRGSTCMDVACPDCNNAVGIFRCLDCANSQRYCMTCIRERHCFLPFHCLEKWTGKFFIGVPLQDVGLIINLGHDGARCASPGEVVNDFIVVDISGVRRVSIKFCECLGAAHQCIQLLHAHMLPATVHRPKTAFTFNVLRSFHLENLQGKISAYDYYTALVQKSDNTNMLAIKDRYEQFLTTIRIWRHLKIIKQGGRGHDPAGIDATLPGQCAVECPACPQPGRNLPHDWESAPPSKKWLYMITRSINANFRLKLKDKKSVNDITLGSGWAHWVPAAPYKEYIAQYGDQTEPNLCDSELHAVDHANTKFSTGYKASGVGGTLCRHSLVCKNGLGDLQKGERYANMDFIVFSSLIGYAILPLLFSYDIICQWWRNLSTWMKQLPLHMQIPSTQLKAARTAIPKFHILGHGHLCQLLYSLNLLLYSGRTDGENIERWWAHINPVSMSTKEMTAGSRHNTIDDHACSWNWRKTTAFGTSLCTQLKDALTMARKHEELFNKLSATFTPNLVAEWEEAVTRWEMNPKAPNPYEDLQSGTTFIDVRLELANEEATDAANGHIAPHEITSSSWLIAGLELEDQQSAEPCLSGQSQKPDNTSRGYASREMNSIEHTEASSSDPDTVDTNLSKPDSIPLHLPSSMSPSLWSTACVPGLVEKEKRLRLAQAHDALTELRRLLQILATLRCYKKKQISGPGQRANTRARALITLFGDKTEHCADRYRAACSALLVLDPEGDWVTDLKPLNAGDVKGPHRNDDDLGEGTRELSWIWLVPSKDLSSDDGDVNQVNEGKSYCCTETVGLTLCSAKAFMLSGQDQEHVPIAGEKNVSFLLRKCEE